jgi:hypothetical protein
VVWNFIFSGLVRQVLDTETVTDTWQVTHIFTMGFKDGCKVTAGENGSKDTDTKSKLECLAFILPLVNSHDSVFLTPSSF